MAAPTLRFHLREPTIDTNRPLTDGTVKIEGFEVVFVAKRTEADAWDAGMGSLLRGRATGARSVSIPAFPNRKFRLSYIYVNQAAGIESPRDLEGKRVGLSSWGNTACMWAKGALESHYKVNLKRIHWFSRDPAETRVHPEVSLQALPAGMDPDGLLLNGDLDALIDPNVLPSISKRDSRVHRLFRDYKAEEQNYFRRTGIFPISHVITLTQEFVQRHPDAPVALLRAYRRARDVAVDRIQGADPQIIVISWASALLDEQRALMGENYWPYNLVDNRRSLEAITEFAYQQGVTPEKIPYTELFSPEAASLPGA